MKPNLSVLLNLFLLFTNVSCGTHSRIQTFNDEFKGSKKILLEQRISPKNYSRSPVTSALITYEREIIALKPDVCKVYFVFTRGSATFDLSNKGFMKIGDSKFEIELKSMDVQHKTGVNDTSTTTSDSTGTHTISSSETVQWINDKFRIDFTAIMVDAIAKNEEITLQFYSGPKPVTLVITGRRFAELKEFIAAK